MKVAPSVLNADFTEMGKTIDMLERGGADWIHLDVMDGVFVPNISFGPAMVEAINRRTDMFLDAHLMITEPSRFVEDFARAGADMITVHAEACTHLHRVLGQIKALGIKAGVALNPATGTDVLEYIYGDVDMILCMSVNPGFGGQKFIPSVLRKLEYISRRKAELGLDELELQVDGGVNLDNIGDLRRAGVTCCVAGTCVVKAADPAAAIRALQG